MKASKTMSAELEFIKAKVEAYKHSLDGKSSEEKGRRVSIQIARQINAIVDEIKMLSPEAARHLPEPIEWKSPFARMELADVTFLDLEMILNQLVAVIDVMRGNM